MKGTGNDIGLETTGHKNRTKCEMKTGKEMGTRDNTYV